MKDAVFIVPTPSLLERVVTMISDIPMDDRDTKGDLYEYLLSKIAQAGRNGQFRTPRHVIKMMVELLAPQPDDVIGDSACGTCGFLVAAGEYLRKHHPKLFHNKRQREHFVNGMFHGADFDASMLRIGAMCGKMTKPLAVVLGTPHPRNVRHVSITRADLRPSRVFDEAS